MDELDQLLGDGVTKNGFDIGERPIYPDSKDLEQRWKNLSVQKREAIIREKLEKER